MFERNKVRAVNNKIDNILNLTETQKPVFDVPQIMAKIVSSSLNAEEKVFFYTWKAVNYDGSDDKIAGGSSDARCIQEIGQDMTGKEPSVKANDIVFMQCDQNGYRFSVIGNKGAGDFTNPLDLINAVFVQNETYYNLSENNTTWGWQEGVKTINGVKQQEEQKAVIIRVLVGQHYDYTEDINYEVFRDLTFDKDGVLCEIKQSEQKTGFETTQFPDA